MSGSPPTTETLLERLRKHEERDELFKAKELALQYPQLRYDPTLWRTCGEVLLRTADVEQAGKHLFFAGSQDPEHQHAIGLYLQRTDNGRMSADLARATPLEALPEHVRQTLSERGVKPLVRRERRVSSGVGEWVVVLPVIALLGLGVWKAIELVKSLFE